MLTFVSGLRSLHSDTGPVFQILGTRNPEFAVKLLQVIGQGLGRNRFPWSRFPDTFVGDATRPQAPQRKSNFLAIIVIAIL